MTPSGPLTGGSLWFLNGMSNLQQQEAQTERQLSSGYQVNDASDAPAQTPALIHLGSSLATYETYQQNLTDVQTEAQTADQSIGSAITLIQNAVVLASQGASSTATAASNQVLANSIQSIQQQLVGLANTTIAGRAIFGGNQDQSAPYQYDSTNTVTGVATLTTPSSSRVVVNPDGGTVYQALTAQQVFNPVDGSGNPAAGSAFAALQSLQNALQANDQTGIANSLDSLQTASTYLNQQQATYGASEQRITAETNSTANQITSLQTSIGNIRDINFAQVASDLTTEETVRSAAIGAQSEISQKNLFDYLG